MRTLHPGRAGSSTSGPRPPGGLATLLVLALLGCTEPNSSWNLGARDGAPARDGASPGTGGASSPVGGSGGGSGAGGGSGVGGGSGAGGGGGVAFDGAAVGGDGPPMTGPDEGTAGDLPRPADSTDGPAAGLAAGLVGPWALDEGPGQMTVLDSSVNGNTGMVTISPLAGAWVAGKKGFALIIPDQVGAGVTVAASPSVARIRGAISIAAWVKRAAASSGDLHTAIVSRQARASRDIYILAFHRDTLVMWIYTDPSLPPVSVRSTRMVPVGEWVHVAATWDGATVTLYQQGQVVATASHAVPFPDSPNPVMIGNNINSQGADQPLNGTIDEVWLHERALTAAEISALLALP